METTVKALGQAKVAEPVEQVPGSTELGKGDYNRRDGRYYVRSRSRSRESHDRNRRERRSRSRSPHKKRSDRDDRDDRRHQHRRARSGVSIIKSNG